MSTIIDPFTGEDYRHGISSRKIVQCSFFEHGATDVEPINWQGSWQTLVRNLLRTFDCDRGIPPLAAKLTLPAICGATFSAETTRRRENVQAVGLLLADFDNCAEQGTGQVHLDRDGRPTNRPVTRKVPLESPITLSLVAESLRLAGVSAMAWSTWSSQPNWPRFRVAIPLLRPVPGDLWRRAADYAIDYLGWGPFRSSLDIGVLRNPSALAFLPGAPDPDSIERLFVDGDPLYLPQQRLAQIAEVRDVLSDWQRNAIRLRSAVPGPRWWHAYLEQGRVQDYRSLDLSYILRSLGCWVGEEQPYRNGTKLRCTCPWHSEHTGGVDDDAAVIFQAPGHWPGWHCSHSSHIHLSLRDVLEAAWGRP